ncbi:unnamed protein product [Echinostoma caproni]|uniref:DUF4537 domain-containing protein n=1 Tax=Echinostoma caproni TaxID=27848 RepID=A0A183B103_9TREM|nr:unnamed protein product [Echinostoma caproni]
MASTSSAPLLGSHMSIPDDDMECFASIHPEGHVIAMADSPHATLTTHVSDRSTDCLSVEPKYQQQWRRQQQQHEDREAGLVSPETQKYRTLGHRTFDINTRSHRSSLHEQSFPENNAISSISNRESSMKQIKSELQHEKDPEKIVSLVKDSSKASENDATSNQLEFRSHAPLFPQEHPCQLVTMWIEPMAEYAVSEQHVACCSTCQLSESKVSDFVLPYGMRCSLMTIRPSMTLTFTDSSSRSVQSFAIKFDSDQKTPAIVFIRNDLNDQSVWSETESGGREGISRGLKDCIKIHDTSRKTNESISHTNDSIPLLMDNSVRSKEITPGDPDSVATKPDSACLRRSETSKKNQEDLIPIEYSYSSIDLISEPESCTPIVTQPDQKQMSGQIIEISAPQNSDGILTTVATVLAERVPSLYDSIPEQLQSVREHKDPTLYATGSTTVSIEEPKIPNTHSDRTSRESRLKAKLSHDIPSETSSSAGLSFLDNKPEQLLSTLMNQTDPIKPENFTIKLNSFNDTATAAGADSGGGGSVVLPGSSSVPTSVTETDLSVTLPDTSSQPYSTGSLPHCTKLTCPFRIRTSDHRGTLSHVQIGSQCDCSTAVDQRGTTTSVGWMTDEHQQSGAPTIGVPCFVIMDALPERADVIPNPEYEVARMEQTVTRDLGRSSGIEISSHLAESSGSVILRGIYISPYLCDCITRYGKPIVSSEIPRNMFCNLRKTYVLRAAPPIFQGNDPKLEYPPLRALPMAGGHGMAQLAHTKPNRKYKLESLPKTYVNPGDKFVTKHAEVALASPAPVPPHQYPDHLTTIAGPAGASGGLSPAEAGHRSSLGLSFPSSKECLCRICSERSVYNNKNTDPTTCTCSISGSRSATVFGFIKADRPVSHLHYHHHPKICFRGTAPSEEHRRLIGSPPYVTLSGPCQNLTKCVTAPRSCHCTCQPMNSDSCDYCHCDTHATTTTNQHHIRPVCWKIYHDGTGSSTRRTVNSCPVSRSVEHVALLSYADKHDPI